ncbi:TerD family protein [Rhodococcus sp. DMU2021]|uniref:TerD family protein n=1 Tax=Rhodococcus sp. DMU2021 TaxID=2866997 RepID=UPI001C7D4B86|nr:TerD family protein [Rhodococcus sp. DMU2021]MBX4170961.1 TerD family protein [Rhodococcus sp. DMU2021]
MDFPVLVKGQNMPLPTDVSQVDIVLGWTEADTEVDASALLLADSGKVRSDADFVFYNQPESADGSVRFLGNGATEEGAQARISIDLATVPDDVHTIALAGSLYDGTFGDLGKLTLRVVDPTGRPVAEYVTADADTESAFVFGEVYRRDGAWKVRAVGQGWASGLAGLAQDYGVEVDDGGEVQEPSPVDPSPTDAENPVSAQIPEPAPVATTAPTARQKSGVRTTKRVARKPKPITFSQAEQESWQPARLFSVAGIGAGDEQERRATSALVATMQAVPPFARAVCLRLGAPAGAFEGYLEVPYERGESRVVPDAVLKVARGSRRWTGLVEVKTGNGKLKREQLENYLDVARRKKYDVVVSISNDIPAAAGELPVAVDRRKLTKVTLRHLAWAEIAHEARMVLSHGELESDLQDWILREFLRYIDHPRSGVSEFVDMGRHWVAVRDAVTAGTLRASDSKALTVASTWVALARHLALRFTAELGVPVTHVLPRRFTTDPDARNASIADRLATDGVFEAVLRIPDTAGDLVVSADLRTNKVRCRTTVDAPDEGTSRKRVSWLVKQLKTAPGNVQLEAAFSVRGNEACEHLDTVRADPRVLTEGRAGDIVSFTLEQTFPLGSRRSSGTATGFITSVTASADVFYGEVVQPLRVWVPAAPQQTEHSAPLRTESDED